MRCHDDEDSPDEDAEQSPEEDVKLKKRVSKTEDSNDEESVEELPSAKPDEEAFLPDKWILTRDVLIRVHNTPRTGMHWLP